MLRKGYPVTNVYLFKNRLWLEEFSTRMHDWFEGDKRPPVKIDAELHRRCNLDCRFCSRRENDVDMTEQSKKIEVPKERWLEIAEESGEMGVKQWNISGIGEPMCKPDLSISVMEKIKSYDMFGEITTNGTLWTDDMIKRVVKMGWDSVCVSLDSPVKKTHNELRGEEAFEDALETLYMFKKYKKELGKKKPTLTINVVLNSLNYKQLPQLFTLAYDLDVDSIFVEPMILYDESAKDLKLKNGEIDEFREISEKCKKIAKDLGIGPNINCYTEDKDYDEELIDNTSEMKEVIENDSEEKIEDYKDPDKSYNSLTDRILSIPCYYPWFYMIITAGGKVSHCGEKVDKTENIEEKDLDEIWYGEEFEKYRSRFRENNLPDYCNRCRPNVVGDARRIRKAVTELRDKEYIINSINDVRYANKNIKDRIELLRKVDEGATLGDFSDENCGAEEELENIKDSNLYKLSSSLSEHNIGNKFKGAYHRGENSLVSQKMRLEDYSKNKLRDILWNKLRENKRLKDTLYNLKREKKIYENIEKMSEKKKELLELRDSLAYKLLHLKDSVFST